MLRVHDVPVRMSITPYHCHALPNPSPHFHPLHAVTPSLEEATGVLGHTSLESVLEAAGDVLEVSHAASADGLSALGLLTPVV